MTFYLQNKKQSMQTRYTHFLLSLYNYQLPVFGKTFLYEMKLQDCTSDNKASGKGEKRDPGLTDSQQFWQI